MENDGLQDQPILYAQKTVEATPEVFLDPNKLSDNGTVAIGQFEFSNSGKYCAYTTAKTGSDWNEAYVIETATKKNLGDELDWLRFSEIAWMGDEGFFYSRYPEPKQHSESNNLRNQKVYYHKIGQPQSADELIYEDPSHPFRFHYAKTTPDNRYLVLYTSEGSDNSQIMIKPIDKGLKEPFKLILEGFKYEAEVFDSDKKFLYVKTNVSAPRYRIAAVNIVNPYVNNWETMIPERQEVIEDVKAIGGSWFVNYMKDASNLIVQFTNGGYRLKDINIPGFSSATLYDGGIDDKELLYSYSSFVSPDQLYKLKVATGESTLFRGSENKDTIGKFETKQVFFYSEDGTKVPIFLTYKKSMQLNGQNPVLLYGYGGFNSAQKPNFKPEHLFFIQQGGIYAQVGLRGGSEYGEKWHLAGMRNKKQNVFDDFIGAAKYLVEENYTNRSKLAISGRSNGGLLVAACMVQKPDMFKVALPTVGVLDMLRYQKFTVGKAWIPEYGSSELRDDFDYLIKYSPLHNLKDGVSYPATFITTGDHDDRVVPAHSYKFTARLQEVQTGNNPVLIRIDSDAGHGTGKPTSKLLAEQADKLAFTMYNLGMTLQ